MGILNVTLILSLMGRFLALDNALAQAKRMIEAGVPSLILR